MEKGTVEATQDMRVGDLKELANAEGPCLTITVPIQPAENTTRQDYMRLKSAAQSAETILTDRGMDPRQVREFLDPMTQIEGSAWGTEFGSLVVFRSPQIFRYFQVRAELKDAAIVADHFQITPFVKALQEEERHFFVLALSQKRTRLLRCTYRHSEELPFGPETPTSLEEWLTTRSPQASAERSRGEQQESGEGFGNFTSQSDRDNMDPHIANFFHQVNAAVYELLRGETSPLVMAGVEYEARIYREVNTYPHLAEGYAQGSPDSLRGPELHRRALELAEVSFQEPMQKALQSLERLGGSERVAFKPAAVLEAAASGRVAHLFLADGAQHPGGWDRGMLRVTSEGEGEDLLNIAALQTLAHAGEIWIMPPEQVPNGGPVAALLRY